MNEQLWQLDATDLARLIRTGRASSREATQSCLARMDTVNPHLNAVVRRMDDEALAAADAADAKRAQGTPLGLLHGVPMTIKVNVDQVGHPTDNGVVAYKDAIAIEDNPVVASFRQAGAVIIGRTNVPAFSMRAFSDNALHGRTLNPRDPKISAGGSSGGAGSAVASGIGPIGHGNDIAGSVRIPAMFNGIVGLRVGLGRVAAFNPSLKAGRPLCAQLMSVQGPLTRTVRDARLALAAMMVGDPRDTRWVAAPLVGPPAPWHAALVAENPGGTIHPAQAEAVRTAGRHLEAAGYIVEEVSPPDMNAAIDDFFTIMTTDSLAALVPLMQQYGDDDARKSMALWLELSPLTDLAGLLSAYARRDFYLHNWLIFLQRYPIVVLPTMGGLAPAHNLDTTLAGQTHMLDVMRVCELSPMLGLPALSVPVGHYGKLRPSVQIMASRFREDLCLAAGEVIEAAEGVVSAVDPVMT
jgi:amidase